MISDERLLAFSRALAESIRSGLSLAGTLRTLSGSPFGGRKLAAAADRLDQGGTLHESLEAQRLFPPLFIALIRAGEESGKTDQFLDRFSESLETRIEFRRKVKRAFFYPAVVLALAAALFVLLAAKVLPILVQPIADAGIPPSAGTALLMRAGQWTLAWWPALLAALLAGAALLRALLRSRPGRAARALAGHWLPGVRFACEEGRFHQIATTFELLLRAGLRPRAAMDILQDVFRDDPITSRRLARASLRVSQGNPLSESVEACLPAEDRRLLKVADQAGRLDEAFEDLAKIHRSRHLHRLKLTADAVRIATTVALAPLCLALILCVLWPSLSLLGEAGKLAPTLDSGVDDARSLSTGSERAPGPAAVVEDPASALFNESQAKGVVDFMRVNAGPPAPSPAPAPALRTAATAPRLAPARTMRKPSFKPIEPTNVQSSF